MEGKPAKKTPKKTRGTDWSTGAPSTLEPSESSIPLTPAEGEHISAIIKKCLESFAPLLLRGSGPGLSIEGAEKGESHGHASKSEQSGGKGQTPPGDPLTAWDIAGKVIEPPKAMGNPPRVIGKAIPGSPGYNNKSRRPGNGHPASSDRKNMEKIIQRHFLHARNPGGRARSHYMRQEGGEQEEKKEGQEGEEFRELAERFQDNGLRNSREIPTLHGGPMVVGI
ncbi:hypothetical protein NDU88_005728 [Pleurodeles waltl]|uniref:Uncharacterized protein n=1 Tax=Pleurodeles waltl TaxID=8319 RepID=A0AAV7QLH6_PLEWA|nr:hypothetical protein NDU88_005728 [Pleurodeles waltl]